MTIRIFIALSALTLCNAKLPKTKSILLSDELSKYNTRLLQEFQPETKSAKTSRIVAEYSRRVRSVFDSKSYESSLLWTHSEKLDENGDIVLRWVNSDGSITFRVEARTRGYLGVGFNSKKDMRGGDLVAAWVDDVSGIAQILDCHGLEIEDKAVTDDVQSYELISGYQNETHTTVEFRRQLDTCDAQDFIIGEDTVQVLWALGPDDSDGQLPKHIKSGSKPLRLVQPIPKPDVMLLKHWDVRLFNLTIPHDKATMFWCKIFKAPDLRTKHHIVGYRPIIDSRPIRNGRPVVEMDAPSPVHHMVLYECDDDGDKALWNEWSDSAGAYGPARPKEWTICTTPVAAWAMGSKGEFLPENVGIPLGGNSGVSYYMLEVHYDNPALHEVLDSSGIRVHFTSELRRHDAGVLGSGIGVSALHVIPPKQIQYKTAGICSAECSRKMLPADGVTIVSAQLHAHGTAKKISLKHVRGNNELRPITQENAYDARYQQSRAVPGGRQFMPGDILITECTYDSTERDKPILGGYSALQEMCLSFVVYYPRTNLAGCYSMTPVKEFFETFGIKAFYGINMLQVENMFLSSGSLDNFDSIEFDVRQHNDDTAMQGDDQGVGLLKDLLIKEPFEFRNKSFIAHLNEMPWTESLLTSQIEKTLYYGTHMTFCKKRDDSWGTPIEIQNFPNYTELVSNETVQKPCHFFKESLPSITKSTISDAGYVIAFSYWSPLICLNLLILAR